MNRLKLVLLLIVACLAAACVSNGDRVEKAIDAGNLKEAEKYLKEIDDAGECYHYGGMLIDEYLAIDNLDKAIYVFDKITGHCSMYDMQWSFKSSSKYTKEYSKKIYDALLKEGRYDEAWNYHEISYDAENYAGNAPDYFAYMTDCIISMCKSGNSMQATLFIKQKSVWFLKNVDNSKSGEEYPNFRYDIMCSELNKVYNSVLN